MDGSVAGFGTAAGPTDSVGSDFKQTNKTNRTYRTPKNPMTPMTSLTLMTSGLSNQPPLPDTNLPMNQWVAKAVEWGRAQTQRDRKAGIWRTGNFHFARVLRTRPDYWGIDGEDIADDLLDNGYVTLSDLDDDETEVGPLDDLIHCLDAVVCPAGSDSLKIAVTAARTGKRRHIPERYKGIGDDHPLAGRARRFELFINIAARLQLAVGDRNIKLPVEKLGKVLGCSGRTVSNLRKKAIKGGYIKLKKKHRFKPGSTDNRATEFRFDLARVPELTDEAGPDGQGE